jgi:serum/glucocorticoid-regulated kinase 2
MKTDAVLDFTVVPGKNEETVKLSDFEIIKLLGEGTFGKVYLVEKNNSGDLFALKTLKKDKLLVDEKILECTILEKKILQQANHPFLIGTDYVFQTESMVYFVMKYIKAGELYTHLRNVGTFDEKEAKFYIMTIALGLGYLHKKKIVYRDLKTKNILMGEDGYIFLADFGLAKFIKHEEKVTSICGTPYMMAPEIIEQNNYGYAVDWYALGVLTF